MGIRIVERGIFRRGEPKGGFWMVVIGIFITVFVIGTWMAGTAKAESTMQGPGYNYVRTVSEVIPGFGPVAIIEVDGHEYVIVRGGITHKADCRGD